MSYLNKSNNIPNYLQKEIIKLICDHTNRINKRLCEFDLSENENQLNNKLYINKSILSISLTCWFWFNQCSNFLNVLIDFNQILPIPILPNSLLKYNNNNINNNNQQQIINNNNNNNNINNNYFINKKYSIIKIENINTLKFQSSIFLNNLSIIDKINKFIKFKSTSLKKILININYNNNINQNNQMISMIGKIEFPFIRISNYEFDTTSTLLSTSLSTTSLNNHMITGSGGGSSGSISIVNSNGNRNSTSSTIINTITTTTSFILPFNIKKIKSIGVLKNYSASMIISNLRNLTSFKELYICNYNNRFPFRELSIQNKLSSIEYYDTHKTSIKIDDLYYMLKSSPNLKLLAFHICFDDLIYQLSCSKHKPKPCPCNNNNNNNSVTNNNNNNNNQIEILPFLSYWKSICKIIKNHKNLKSLFIHSLCKNGENSGNQYLSKSKISNHFITQFGTMISKNKSIKKLICDGFHTPQLLQFLILNNGENNTSSSSNVDNNSCGSDGSSGNNIQSIQFQFQNFGNNISNQNKLEYIDTFDKLLTNSNYNHKIKSFKYIENFFKNDNNNNNNSSNNNNCSDMDRIKSENILYTFEKY